MEDKKIIDLYWRREQAAISETAMKYGRYCHYIAYQILGSDQDAEEVANDTYLRAWSSIPPNRPKSLKGYLATLCSRLALDRYDSRTAQKRGGGQMSLVLEELGQCVPGDNGDMADSLALREALEGFLRGLPVKTRRIFLRRYWYLSPIAEIARDYGMKESAVAMLLLRTREKLKHHLEMEGFER